MTGLLRHGRLRRVRHRPLRRAIVPIAVAAIVATGPSLPIRLNLTPSLPRGLYLETTTPPVPGLLILVCLPEPPARLGLARGYLHPGSCPSGAAPALKRIAATAGDTVSVTAAGVNVTGRLLPASAPRSVDRAGRSLSSQPRVPQHLAPGEIWLHAPRPDSWDSRYYGPVPVAAILTTMRPLLVLPSDDHPAAQAQ